MTFTLAIDTSTLISGVALGSVAQHWVRRGRVTSHSDELLQMVADVVAESGHSVRELTGIVCGAGPGSFTGLRIGLATCKGLAISIGCPLLLVSSLATMAARAPDGECLAVLDAFKDEVYVGRYTVAAGVPTLREPERVLSPAQLLAELAVDPARHLVGDGALRYPQLQSLGRLLDDDGSPRPLDLLRLGAARLAAGEASSLANAVPHYIRRSEAEIMKDKKASV